MSDTAISVDLNLDLNLNLDLDHDHDHDNHRDPTLNTRDQVYIQSLEASLQDSFRLMCSKEQVALARSMRILTKSERKEMKRCAKIWKPTPISSTPDNTSPNDRNNEEWNATIECLMTLRDRYQSQLDLMRVRSLESDAHRSDMLTCVQDLSRRLGDSGQTHEELESLSGALEQLRRQWKKSKPEIESIIHSILSATPLAASGCRVVRATRSNIGLLGLGYRSINKHYLVFESGRTPLEDCKEILLKISSDFGQVFEENAAQNLASMEGNYQHIFMDHQDTGDEQQQVMQDIQRLADSIFTQSAPTLIIGHQPGSQPKPNKKPTLEHEHNPTHISQSGNDNGTIIGDGTIIGNGNFDGGGGGGSGNTNSQSQVLVQSQSQSQVESEDNSPLFTMSRPVFEPAGWDWPTLLKHKQPNTRKTGWVRPFFQRTFSIRSKSTTASTTCTTVTATSTGSTTATGITNVSSNINSNSNININIKTTGLWTCSISRLADHFAKVGHDYYTNMLNNTNLMHSHQSQLFESSTRLLMKCYQALQIEHAHANIISTSVQVYQLKQEAERTNHHSITP
ncbi:hypothetical protein J3Q64DRAFT_1739120 [Phycomyces blakesleeanus]|uniref:Uncharacterized protein n=2 Tax=Phycomyces blakesleeanus TaxID=4837 RepID=A0A162PYX5_PHYB8|nr:hypothetical protein PHYBLDRAFT_143835 [Phycomyces blakesleeanus NRRL 1555(-)]OAD75586.1 hypothetical protein PHYBLDRAFT_143835 [Phycomyces blakesleeanus NRRL 1555(-)]|eukprot:XP_018293626.1 hypothetical protein PHYBLDRAFT_143835 [Phycomyces blakesleeanus NRRL 1555(-)]